MSSKTPTITNTSSNFSYRLPDTCISMCSTYSFSKTGGSSGASSGITPYYYLKTDITWSESIQTTIGSYYHQPTNSNCTYNSGLGSSFYGAYFNVPTNDGEKVNFTFCIWFY